MAAAQQVDDTYASAGTSEHFEDDDVLNSLPPNSQRHRPDGGEHRETFLPSDSVVVDGINHGCVDGLVDSDDEADAGDGTEDDGKPKDRKPCYRRAWKRWRRIYAANSFLILVVCAILLALAYPPLGAVYLAPQITATWIAVIFIFVLAGLGLRTSELSKALKNIWFNTVVQCFNFFVVSSVVFGVSRFLISVGALARALADGMVIGTSVPMTINMVLVLTKSSGGDEASAVFNAAFGNLTGVFLTPVLILAYLGVSGDIDLVSVFYKLGLRVILPIAVGQLLQKFSKTVVNFVKKYKKYFKQAQEYCLVFIIYTVFCRTFLEGSEAKAADIFIMIAIQFVLLCSFMVLAWYLMKLLFRNQPKLRVMGLYGVSKISTISTECVFVETIPYHFSCSPFSVLSFLLLSSFTVYTQNGSDGGSIDQCYLRIKPKCWIVYFAASDMASNAARHWLSLGAKDRRLGQTGGRSARGREQLHG